MKAVPKRPQTLALPLLATVVSFFGCSLFQAGAQIPAPNPSTAKPPVHKPEQSALNRVKQDERAQKALEESKAALKDSDRRLDAAAKEIQRLDKDALKADPKKALKAIADKLSPEDTAKLKEELKKAGKEFLDSDEAKRLLEEAKKKGGAKVDPVKKNQPAVSPNSSGPPVPTTFDKIPAPVPLPVAAFPSIPKRKITSYVEGDVILIPPTHDPANPSRLLSPSDPMARTYVITGNALMKTVSLTLNADRIECLKSADAEGGGIFGGANPSGPVKKTETGRDALLPEADAEKDEEPPIDRMVATGRVQVVRIENGAVSTGHSSRMVYERKTGHITLTGWPTAQTGNQNIVGKAENSVIILVPKGEPKFENCRVESLLEGKKTAVSQPAQGDTKVPRAKVVP